MTKTSTRLPLRRLSDHLIELLLVASLIVIIYVTLFPFDFRFSSVRMMADEIAAHFDLRPSLALIGDILNNIVLFIPLGFCITALAFGRMRMDVYLTLATLCGSALSGLVEVLQIFLGRRSSSINDVLANSLGSLIGALVLLLLRRPLVAGGYWFVDRAEHLIGRRMRSIAIGIVALVWAGWLGFNIYVPIRLYHASWLMFWDRSYPLSIGNEATGDRPWEGTVRRVAISCRAVTQAEAESLAQGEKPEEILGRDLMIDFDLHPTTATTNANIPDRLDPTRQLRWSNPASSPLRADGLTVGSQAFLSCEEMHDITNRIVGSDQFTIFVDAASASIQQDGPARIASISPDTKVRNLTIGQDGSTLAVRIRFPLTGANGGDPELLVNDVFTDTQPRRIVVTWANSIVRICVGGLPPRTEKLVMIPELSVMWRLFPRCGWGFRLGTSAIPVYRILYRMMVFGTLGATLYIGIMLINVAGSARLIMLLAGWLIPIIAIEGLHTWIESHFSVEHAMLSLLIGMAGTILGWLWIRRLAGRQSAG